MSSSVGPNSPASKVVASAVPIVSSSIAATKPPWMWPNGLIMDSGAVNSTLMRPLPGTASRTVHPVSWAQGGGGCWPLAACQKG